MRHLGMAGRATVLAAAVFAFGMGPVAAQAPDVAELGAAYQVEVTPVFTGNTTIIGQTITYPLTGVNPAGAVVGPAALVTNAIVTIPPGGETGWHTHAVPLFAYILEGTVTVDYGSKGVHTMSAGSSFMEAMNWAHNAHNYGTTPVRILAVYLGVAGTPNAATATGAE